MPFDSHRSGPEPAPLLYLLPAGDAEPEQAMRSDAEMAGLRALGRPLVPLRLDRRAEEPPPPPPPPLPLPRALARHPVGLARALRLAFAQRGLPPAEALRRGAEVAEAARRHGCGSIHAAAADATATAALVGARLAGLPASIAGRGRDLDGGAADLALKLAAADLAVAECTGMAEEFRRLAPRARVRAVPAAVDAALYRPWPGAGRNGRLLCLAPLLPRGGHGVLIRALRDLPQGERPVVDAIGAGPLLETLRGEALEAGVSDHIRFLGALGAGWVAEEGPRYMGLVEPGIVAPDGDRDPLPVAVLQAMAMELPVVATGLMALREVVQPDSGHLVPPGEALSLSRGLRWLATMPEEIRRRLGRAGRERVLAGHTPERRSASLARALALAG